MNKIGSREDVMSGIAKKTSGGLTKQKLKYNKQQKIVSRKVSNIAKKNNRLGKARYITKNRYDGGQVGGVVKQTITFNYVYVNTSEIDKVTFINSVNESVSLLFFANINDGTPVAYLMYNDDLYPITMCTLFRYDEMPGNNFKTRRKQKWQEHEYLVINATNLPQFIINRSFIYPLTAMYIYYLLKEPSIERVGFDDLMLEWNRMEQKDHNKYEQYEQYEKESANFNLEKLKSNLGHTYIITNGEKNGNNSKLLIYEILDPIYNIRILSTIRFTDGLSQFRSDMGVGWKPALIFENNYNTGHSLEAMLRDIRFNSKFIILNEGIKIKAIAFLSNPRYLGILMAVKKYGEQMMQYIKKEFNYSETFKLHITPSSNNTTKLVSFYSRPWVDLNYSGHITYTKCDIARIEKIDNCIKCFVKISQTYTEGRDSTYHNTEFDVIFKFDDIKLFLGKSHLNKLTTAFERNELEEFRSLLNSFIQSSKTLLNNLTKYFISKRGNKNATLRCVSLYGIINELSYIQMIHNNCFQINMKENELQHTIAFRYSDIYPQLASHPQFTSQTDSILLKTMIGKRRRKQNPIKFIDELNRLLKSDYYFNTNLYKKLRELDSVTNRCK